MPDNGLFPRLPCGPWDILYADPPWDYQGRRQFNETGAATSAASAHYACVPTEHLAQLPVAQVAARNSLLFLWATGPHMSQAVTLGEAWGFAYATVAFVWHKQATNPGHYTLSECEFVLVFRRGRIPAPRGTRRARQWLSQMRGPHSAKPAEVRCRIDEMFPHSTKLELFARQTAPGWTTWGLPTVGAPLGLTIDEPRPRLFVPSA